MTAIQVRKVVILGSGTSTGVPVVGCSCEVCRSEDPYDKRTRCSILLELTNDKRIVVDTSPEFRLQLLANKIDRIDAVLYTHTHADHCHGFDDLRVFSFFRKDPLPVFLAPDHATEIRERFHYAFENTGYEGATPQLQLHEIGKDTFDVLGLPVEPVYLPHGGVTTTAYRFGDFAYATDFKGFPPEVLAKWQGRVPTMVASAIRYRPHSTHSNIPETLDLFAKLGVKQGFLTHLSHDVGYGRDSGKLPPGAALAYDGMVIDLLP